MFLDMLLHLIPDRVFFGKFVTITASGLSLEAGDCNTVAQACHCWAMSPVGKGCLHTCWNEVSDVSMCLKVQCCRQILLFIAAATRVRWAVHCCCHMFQMGIEHRLLFHRLLQQVEMRHGENVVLPLMHLRLETLC